MGAIKIQVAMGGLLAKLTLSRPEKYNAFDREMLRELAEIVRGVTDSAKFRAGYGRVGLTVDGGLSWRLPRIVGMAQAQRIVYEDPDIDADEAHALGIIHQVVPQSELVKKFEELVERTKLQSRSIFAKN